MLSDYNLDQGSIDFCLKEIKDLREGNHRNIEDQKWFDDPDDSFGEEVDELEVFLKELKIYVQEKNLDN